MTALAIDAGQLSSGTMAGLIGSPFAKDIDKAQADFVAYCMTHGHAFDNWIDAWAAHTATAPLQTKMEI
tara:strand:+ start:713 stop:919 length:207 start_codon:yes stop_codon:yes gene_type:complete